MVMSNTFGNCAKFNRNLAAWSLNPSVQYMINTFGGTALDSCNKRRMADAWATNSEFISRGYVTLWASDLCPPVRSGGQGFARTK